MNSGQRMAGGSSLSRFSARRRMPRQAVALKVPLRHAASLQDIRQRRRGGEKRRDMK